MSEFLELPIQVQHVWDAYTVVDDALQDLEQGQFMAAAMLSDAVYTDDRVLGVLSTRINALFALPMDFKYQGQTEGGEAPPEPGGEEDAVLELKKDIRDRAKKHWSRMFPAAALKEQTRWGILLNAGLGELVWSWSEEGEFIPTLKTWNSQFLYWRWDTRSYWLIHEGGQVEVWPGDGRWVLFSPLGHNHGWLYGLIRALGKLWLDRTYAFRDWARASEKWSLGIMKGFEPADGSVADKQRFRAGLTNMASESVVLLPTTAQGSKFDLEMVKTDPATGWESFRGRIHQLDTSIAVCVLGQNLSTEVSDGGSRAAAQVHENVRGDFLKADAEVLATMVCTQVLAPWVQANWGDIAAELGVPWRDLVPEVSWQVDPPEDKEQTAKAIAEVATAIPLLAGTEADIRALLERFDIPVLERNDNADAPPPGADVDERPGAGEEPPGNPRDNEDESPRDDEQPESRSSRKNVMAQRVPRGLKRGAKRGQVFADDLVDAARAAAARELAVKREALLHICRTSPSYEDMRQRIKALYMGSSARELRDLVEKSLLIAQLVGRLSSHEDRKGNG